MFPVSCSCVPLRVVSSAAREVRARLARRGRRGEARRGWPGRTWRGRGPARAAARPRRAQGARATAPAAPRRRTRNRATANCACGMRGHCALFLRNPKARPRKGAQFPPGNSRESSRSGGGKWLMGGECRDSVVVYPEIGETKKGNWPRGNGPLAAPFPPARTAFPHYPETTMTDPPAPPPARAPAPRTTPTGRLGQGELRRQVAALPRRRPRRRAHPGRDRPRPGQVRRRDRQRPGHPRRPGRGRARCPAARSATAPRRPPPARPPPRAAAPARPRTAAPPRPPRPRRAPRPAPRRPPRRPPRRRRRR